VSLADKDFIDYFGPRNMSFKDYAKPRPWNYYFAVERILEVFGKRKVSILDVGCADGMFKYAVDFSKLKHTYEGVDLSKLARKEFRKNYKDKLYTNLDKVNSKYDVVVCLQTLEHCEEPDKFIVKLFSRVKKGGILIITIPIENRIPCQFHRARFNHYHVHILADSVKPKDFGIYYINRDNKFTGKLNCFGLVIKK